MDIRTFLSCQPWLVPLKAAATGGDSAEENSNSGASITDAHARAAPQPPPRKKRRRSSAASSQSNKDKGMKHTPPSVKTLVKGSLRFGASLDSPVPLPKNLLSASPGDPASSISQGLKSGNPSQQSMMAMSKSWTPKRAKQTPMILHFAPLKAKASASAELEVPTTNSSNVTTKKPPPKFADTKRNGRVVVPLEAAKKQGKVGKESTRVGSNHHRPFPQKQYQSHARSFQPNPQFQYSLHLHPKHPLLLLSLQLSSDSMTNTQQQPTVYLIDPTQIASLSLPPENPEPSPVPPHVTCVFTSGCTIYFETEVVKAVDKDKAGKEPPVIGKEHKKQEDKVDKGKGPANEKKDDGEKEKAVEKVVQVKKRAEPRNSQAHLALILRK